MSTEPTTNAEVGSGLPEILGKMRILPNNRSQTKPPMENFPNPFQISKPLSATNLKELRIEMERMFGTKCECSHQRSCPSKSNTRFSEHTILNQKQFKQRKRSDLKLLKEPTLKLVEQCLAHHAVGINSSASSTERAQQPVVQTLSNTVTNSVQDRLTKGFLNWNLEGSVNDFKSLVKECESLSLSNTTVSDLHKSRSFRTHQSRSIKTSSSSRPSPALHLEPNKDPLVSSRQLLDGASAAESVSSHQRPSCSQQALMNQANCDVTIDELACYFETFVHIPKKMSSMAEMMYI